MKNILVTGGAGFIGSHFVDLVISETDFKVIVLDKLTYAGKIENMTSFLDLDRVQFIKGDICDYNLVSSIFEQFEIDLVINFAAESHVDNSIDNPILFFETNVIGTLNLLQSAYFNWSGIENWKVRFKFIQISTDEVYGMLGNKGRFNESMCLQPSSPYSSSKASADLLCLSYFKTFELPIVITRSSNNFGPRQHIEKFIPKLIMNTIKDKKIPIYGNGMNVREWQYVKDNCYAIYQLIFKSKNGEIYNIGGGHELTNVALARNVLKIIGKSDDLISFVVDRPGHDFRYSVDDKKLTAAIGQWHKKPFDEAILETISYYQKML